MKQVLIIDPSETFLRYMSRIISRMGYGTQIAYAVEDALALIQRSKPDLVIAELNYPESDGLHLLRTMSGSVVTASIPVVFVSTDGTAESEQRARQAGCADYLTKPITVRDIHTMLQRAMPFSMKRRMPRIRVELAVEVSAAGRKIETRTAMLSAGGMLIVAASDGLHVGLPVAVSLSLPAAVTAMPLAGEIVYITEHVELSPLAGIGVKFLAVEREDADCLTRYIEDALSRPFSAQ
jgi:CheY-like chemotaxis protein/Tfp pilus assembly protein PilZ